MFKINETKQKLLVRKRQYFSQYDLSKLVIQAVCRWYIFGLLQSTRAVNCFVIVRYITCFSQYFPLSSNNSLYVIERTFGRSVLVVNSQTRGNNQRFVKLLLRVLGDSFGNVIIFSKVRLKLGNLWTERSSVVAYLCSCWCIRVVNLNLMIWLNVFSGCD